MTKYVVESGHEPEECLRALKEMTEGSEPILDKFVFACKSGEHIGWAYIDANSEEDAKKIVPEFIRDKACVHEVEKFTAEQIKATHE